MKIVLLTFSGLLLLAGHALVYAAEETDPEIRFNDQIRPILSAYCFACHGPDSGSRKADLRLDDRESAIDSGAVSPGDPANSELISRIFSDDPDLVMPPPETGKTLSNEERDLLRRWVEAGADWEPHWAFIKPQRPKLPAPAGADTWARNEIDLFVLQKLHELGLEPNGQEDQHLLARRAAFDLTGLPPTPELLEEFFSLTGGSPAGPDAYEQYIDRLFASQHAGEHRARYWLDAARYGDTHGMHVDNYREIWPYRDWVIRAFNNNMPFDQFVVEQIAGDLLPNPSLDQQIATGFSRCNITTSEGGAIPEELDVRYMVDRVETTSTVFLGLTAGCAVCHDHKYDPLSQREFYQLGAFFNNTTQPAMDGNQKDTPPVVVLPAKEFEEEWNQLQKERRQLRQQLTELSFMPGEWWPNRQRDARHPIADDELLLCLPLTEGEGDAIELPESATWETEHPFGTRGVRFGENSEFSIDFPQLKSDEALTISFWFRTPDDLISTTLFDQTQKVAKKGTEDKEKPEEVTVGWKITSGTAGNLNFEIFDRSGNDVSGRLPDNDALKPRAWQHVCVRYSGGQSTSSITILLNGRQIALRNSTEEHIEATELADVPLKVAGSLPTAGMSDVRIFRRWVNDEEVQLLAVDGELRRLLNSDVPWDDLQPEERDRLDHYYQRAIRDDSRNLSRELANTQLRRDYIYSRSTTTLIMEERPTAPRAWVLQRGEYDRPVDEVTPNVPAALPSLPSNVPGNRLALADWLVDPDHPLTARVTVNRLWQSIFGTGLVKTSEDFGIMGDRPSHPELLDWLAVEFVESGWDVNHMLKLMVTSAAYRQSCKVTPEKLADDVENRLLSRGPRMRLDAEALRDQALAVSGLLQPDVGGPSVKPYQPAGLWNVVAITGSNTRYFKKDTGPALYRRSLYTFWKRTSPPPSMAAFNAPTREQCTVRRERTNTPLQALVLMNDPQFVESARFLAERTLRKFEDDESRAKWMLETVLCRPASDLDVTEMSSTAVELRKTFQQNEESASELVKTGDTTPDPDLNIADLAAWTMVANILMNRDDFINK
ncbi:MAG: DUF1553 domain-containing protein [Planctomycetaceae bacterium]|nr:DUF1553 domain-containing protein [Planctomycetaceae bacterium]